jgi:hypothetical protein
MSSKNRFSIEVQFNNVQYVKVQIDDPVSKALILLWSVSWLTQNNNRFNKDNMSIKSYLKEFCTTKCGTARQTGHSDAIINFLVDQKYITDDKKIVFSPTYNSKQALEEKWNKKLEYEIKTPEWSEKEINHKKENTIFEIFNNIDYTLNHLRDVKTNIIIIDCASFLSKHQVEKIYDLCCPLALEVFNKNKECFYIIFME